MRICVGKSANPERVLPSMAMETVGETVLPAAVEAVGMAETIDEKAVSGKSGRKKPENMLEALQCFLTARYDFVITFSPNRRSIVEKRCRMKSMV